MNVSLNSADAIVLIAVVVLCVFCVRFIVGFFKDPRKKQ